ncbi:hypothetical protein [Sphaerisporangium sp. TRM90804]|uniref:hypothetical protein n=1 Tax=Sphaerisporangium sp. TRM90804 TaxID=3031113 RepID=UPI002446CCB6|nr:hypothetical protein [Sphaerisporangium sp. TRM90804]MDH2426884.1 hypothetical protein [Sphaerisporangium sp. TRM90804]
MVKATGDRRFVVMSIFSILGGVIGYVAGLFWLQPAILIPIGVVAGLSVGLAVSRRP